MSRSRSGTETRIRTHALATRWSPDEYALLEDLARYSGCSRATVLRRLVSRDHGKILPSRELTREVRRLGNNINQLTRAVHAGKQIPGNALDQIYGELLAALIEMRA